MTGGMAKWTKKISILLFWLAVWQAAAWAADSKILMVGPWDTVRAWFSHMGESDFIKVVLFSFGRITAGFLCAFAAGVLLGVAACRFRIIIEVLSPFMTMLKAVPVASFVVLLLIWRGSESLSSWICFFIVLPQVYISMYEGLGQADKKLLEMAQVFRMPLWNRIFYIYRPALQPVMDTCLKISLGMSWKSGVAAEVIGTPAFSIGEKLYMSKIFLDTAGVFAWTATVILLSFLFEKLGLLLWRSFCGWQPACRMPAADKGMKAWRLDLMGMEKTYDGRKVFSGITKEIKKGNIYCLMAPSGAGKTTLMKILAGLEKSDGQGRKMIRIPCSMVFQEDRLLEDCTAVLNVAAVCGSSRKEEIREQLQELLGPETPEQKCGVFSGGMKRRVSLVRAVMTESDILLLDEPFAGLDGETKRIAADYLLRHRQGRTVILATHDHEDAMLLGGEIWNLNSR